MHPIVFATGTFYQQQIPVEEWTPILEKLPIDGVEFTMARWEELEKILKNEETLKTLKNYKHNILHAPFKTTYKKETFTKDMEKIKRFINTYNIKHAVFHLYNFSDLQLLEEIPFPYTVENTLKGEWHSEKISELLKDNPHYKMTFDTSHALHFEELETLAQATKKSIAHIHLGNVAAGEHHKQFYKQPKDWEKVRTLIDKLPQHIPITIEEDYETINEYEKEIIYVKGNLRQL